MTGENEKIYKLIAENVSDALWTMSLDMRYTYASPSMKKICGFEPEEFLSFSITDVITTESLRIVAPLFEEEIISEMRGEGRDPFRSKTLEVQQYIKGGGWKWVETTASFIHDANGRATGILGVTRDISERKKIEEALRESEEKYRILVENSHDAVYIYRHDNCLFANKRACEIIGFSLEEVLKMTVWDILHPEDKERIFDYSRKRFGGLAVPEFYEARIITRTGQIRHIDFAVQLINYQGSPAALGTVHDITERKEAERQKSEIERLTAESKFREALELSRHILFRFSIMSDRYDYLAPVAQEIFGYPVEEMIEWGRRDFSRMLHADDFVRISDLMREIFVLRLPCSKFCIDFECRRQIKSGEYKWFQHWFTVYHGENGKPESIAGSIIDISERKESEERTRMALEKEKELGELKTRIVSMVSHEFRTPLTSAVFALDIMMEKEKKNTDAETSTLKYQRIIRQSVAQMTAMLDDVNLLSKIETGRLVSKPQSFMFDSYIVELIEQQQILAPHHLINLTVEPEVKRMVSFDKNLLNHVLTNLINNAVKYSPEESVIDVVSSVCENKLRIAVTDKGMGIPEKDLQHIGESFYRGSNVGTVRGTGLGLTIVYEMAKRLNGIVKCTSTVGKGTCFTVDFELDSGGGRL